ncbi:hypothetical protein EH223_04565 [candidate division KSB1 bacterium]|nr:arylsulfatase [candidate division KSB1 bacterium]RQW05553.1 MAG: hypothetical protein EH223_04565 [candidate division KSB1 bacterium]
MPNLRRLLFVTSLVAGFLFFLSCTSTHTRHPNIIFILADDLGYGDLSCLNPDAKISTPNMDRLAREGIYFTDAHSGAAVCTPTRYGILTGRYCWRSRLKAGVLWGYSPLLVEKGRMTVAAMLKKHGYRTACVGKWHLGLGDEEKTDYTRPLASGPHTVGFDYFFGIPASLDMIPYVYVENDRVVEQPTDTVAEVRDGGVFWRGGPIVPNFQFEQVLPTLTEKALSFINDCARTPEQPFFLYFPLTAPHTPWVPTKDFLGASNAGLYGDFVAQVDWTVGQILKKLDEHHLANNTLVILTSDNGSDERYIGAQYGHDANYIFRGQKSDVWDGGHRVPFLARWPKRIKAHSRSDESICLTDFMSTVAAVVGEALPDTAAEDSYNILPVLEGRAGSTSVREAIVHHSVNGMFAIRQGDWKLIYCKGSGGWSLAEDDASQEAPWQLYNLQDDISEQKNLYFTHPEVVKRLDNLFETIAGIE